MFFCRTFINFSPISAIIYSVEIDRNETLIALCSKIKDAMCFVCSIVLFIVLQSLKHKGNNHGRYHDTAALSVLCSA